MNLELLSPAGNFESVKVAIANGADAVYLGAKLFNARKRADNLDDDELFKACEYAHIFGKKVYLTVNTILGGDNFGDLYNLITSAISAKVDAYIIQDLGVLQFIKSHFSGLELHASTQMAIHNVQGCVMAKKLGFTRVVLSRETPLEEIRKIKESVDIELEYFIQGALCVAFSGNCYLSAALKGESGNKGRCLQLCRLPYVAKLGDKEIKKGFLLSAKDFNMSKRIKELADAGVISFKIEGRARRIGYNAIVTNAYRKIFDNIILEDKKPIDLDGINNDIKVAFNRGNYTEGYFNGNGNIIYDKIQGHIGNKIGKISRFEAGNKFNVVHICTKEDIVKGDSYKIIRDEKEICTIAPVDIKNKNGDYVITTTAKMQVGDEVYKIVDFNLENDLTNKMLKKPVNMCLVARPDENMKLIAQCDDISVEVIGDKALLAQNQPATMQSVYDSLSRLKETEFELAEFMAILNNVFIKKQDLNNLRKSAIELLKQKIIEKYNQKFQDVIVLKQYEKQPEIDEIIEKLNKNGKNLEKNNQIDVFLNNFIKRDRYFAEADCLKDAAQNKDFVNIYNVLFSEDIEIVKRYITKVCPKFVVVNNISHIEILKEIGYDGNIIVGPLLNIANIYAAGCISDFGVDAIILSPETYENDYSEIKQIQSLVTIKQNMKSMPLMTFVHCPIKNLYNSTCKNCMWQNGITMTLQSGEVLELCRVKLSRCYFNLYKKVD